MFFSKIFFGKPPSKFSEVCLNSEYMWKWSPDYNFNSARALKKLISAGVEVTSTLPKSTKFFSPCKRKALAAFYFFILCRQLLYLERYRPVCYYKTRNKIFFYSLECAICKVRNLSNCTARKSAKICREKKSGKYIYASRSYRCLEFRPHRSSFADFLHGDLRCTCRLKVLCHHLLHLQWFMDRIEFEVA